MTQKIENLINLLAQKSINYHDFISKANDIQEIKELFDPKDLSMWRALGINIIKLDNGKITLKTRETDIDEQLFCAVDIETNGSIKDGQIIEIGAVKIKNGDVVDKFNTLVFAKEIPENIIDLTGIHLNDLKNAPNITEVMEKFRLFLSDCVFIAHNVKFDYAFVSKSLEDSGFGMLLNRRICTIELARRTIPSQKYGLSSLKKLIGVQNTHHRAFFDAVSCAEIFKESLKRIPWNVQSVEDLILFSKTAPSVKIPQIFKTDENNNVN